MNSFVRLTQNLWEPDRPQLRPQQLELLKFKLSALNTSLGLTQNLWEPGLPAMQATRCI